MSTPLSVYKRKPKRLPKSKGFSRYALDFDGVEDTVDCGNDSTLQPAAEFTVSAWVKNPSSLNDSQNAVRKEYVYALGGGWSTGKTGFYIYTSGGSWLYSGDSTTDINDGNWHHIVGVYNGSDLLIYVDGVLENTNNIGSITLNSNTNNLYIGSKSGAGEYWSGPINEPRIYDRALSAEEIRRNMLNYHNPSKNGLVGWWRLEEGTGLTAYDQSGNGNHGTLNPTTDPPVWTPIEKWELRSEAGL